MRPYSTFSLVFLATTTVLVVGQATPINLCAFASYRNLCNSLVKGQNDVIAATDAIIHRLIDQTNNAKTRARRIDRNEMRDTCIENYDLALNSLKKSLNALRVRDKGALQTQISAAIASYSTCEDTYDEFGETSPFSKSDRLMEHMADSCLAVYKLAHL